MTALEARILAELRTRYGKDYRCPNSSRQEGEPGCVPWFSFRWLSRPGEPGRIRVWVSCATAELDDEFDVWMGADADVVEGEDVGVLNRDAQPILNRG